MLVGGEGTRLRPLTYSTPKQLLPVAGLPMLERVLSQLSVHGIDEAVLSLGYRPDAFLASYPHDRVAGVHVEYAVEPEPLDTAGAVRFSSETGEIADTFLVVNGDVLTDFDVSALVGFHRQHGALATIALTAVEDPSRFGVVPTAADGRVETFLEKPAPGEAPTNRINAGIYVLEPAVLGRIPSGRRVSIERETFPALVEEGALFARYDDAYWLDTGTPQAYIEANADYLTGRRGVDPVAGATRFADGIWTLGTPVIDGTVLPASLVGDGSRVAPASTVSASVLGAGCVIEGGALVEDSVLLDGVRVAEGATVRRSIVGGGAVVEPGATVEDTSVIGYGAVVPAGSHLRNARLPALSD